MTVWIREFTVDPHVNVAMLAYGQKRQRGVELGRPAIFRPASIALGTCAVPDVVAIIHAYNEAEILEATLAHLTGQGIGVYLLDNWSTDGTVTIAHSFLGKGVVGVESFPEIGPVDAGGYDLRLFLRRKEVLAVALKRLGARWIIHYDADELRESPWPGISLCDGLRQVESEGFNAYRPVWFYTSRQAR